MAAHAIELITDLLAAVWGIRGLPSRLNIGSDEEMARVLTYSCKQRKRDKILFNFCLTRIVRSFKGIIHFLSITSYFVEHEQIGKKNLDLFTCLIKNRRTNGRGETGRLRTDVCISFFRLHKWMLFSGLIELPYTSSHLETHECYFWCVLLIVLNEIVSIRFSSFKVSNK